MKALDAVDAKILEKGKLCCSFDAFHQDRIPTIADESNHVLKHHQTAWVRAVVQEGSIDLDRLKLDCPQP